MTNFITAVKKALSNNFVLPYIKGNRFVFIYHDISEESERHHSEHYSTTPQQFLAHIDFFNKNFSLVSLDTLLSDEIDPKKNYASIVFDDGFHSVLTNAKPVLDKFKIPYSVFANKTAIEFNRLWLTDIILENEPFFSQVTEYFKLAEMGKDKQIQFLMNEPAFPAVSSQFMSVREDSYTLYMDYAELNALKEEGVIIGNHTVSHFNMAVLDHAAALNEIYDNKKYLDEKFNQDTTHFAFPFGKKEHFNEQSLQIASQEHRYIYSSNPVSVRGDHTGAIPRIGLTDNSTDSLTFLINRQFFKKIQI